MKGLDQGFTSRMISGSLGSGDVPAAHFASMMQGEKAEAAHQRALQIYEKLVQEHPDVWDYAYQLGRCYYNLALDAQLERQWDAMLTYDEKAIEILQHLVAKGHGQVRSDLLDVRLLHATMLAGRGEHARATNDANAVAREEGVGQASTRRAWSARALNSLPGAVSTGRTAPLLTSSDVAHTTVVSIGSV